MNIEEHLEAERRMIEGDGTLSSKQIAEGAKTVMDLAASMEDSGGMEGNVSHCMGSDE